MKIYTDNADVADPAPPISGRRQVNGSLPVLETGVARP